MTPPINIDGSTVDAITIDGTEVTEVTADGEVVFGSAIPDSVVQQFDATKALTGTQTTVTDQMGFADMTGSVSVLQSSNEKSINNQQTFYFDGTQSVSHSSTIATSDPFAICWVGYFPTIDQNGIVFDGGSDFEFAAQDFDAGNVRTFRDVSREETPYEFDTNVHTFTFVAENVDEIRIREDGVDQSTSVHKSSNLTGLTISNSADAFGFEEQYIGQLEVLKNPAPVDISSVENRLSSKWF
jgi:hypothetical protein